MKVITDPTEAKRYLWQGLDIARFRPLAVVLHDNEPIVLMHENDVVSLTPWCAQYRGSGRYFKTLTELDAYCDKRWHFSVTDILNKTEVAKDVCESV